MKFSAACWGNSIKLPSCERRADNDIGRWRIRASGAQLMETCDGQCSRAD
jgi:hypothetical protein